HFAAFLIAQVTALLKGFKRVVFACARKRKKQLTPQEIAGIQQLGLPQDVEGYEELSQKGASSTAVSVGLTSEVGTDIAGAVGATVTATGTHTTYYKKNAKNQPVRKVGTSRVFTFKLSLGLPGTPIKCDITTTRTIRENVGNTDSLNIKVAPSIPLGGPILQQAAQNAPTVLAGSSFEDGAMRFIKAL